MGRPVSSQRKRQRRRKKTLNIKRPLWSTGDVTPYVMPFPYCVGVGPCLDPCLVSFSLSRLTLFSSASPPPHTLSCRSEAFGRICRDWAGGFNRGQSNKNGDLELHSTGSTSPPQNQGPVSHRSEGAVSFSNGPMSGSWVTFIVFLPSSPFFLRCHFLSQYHFSLFQDSRAKRNNL